MPILIEGKQGVRKLERQIRAGTLLGARSRFVYDRWGNRTSVYDYLISIGTPPPPIQSVSLVQSSSIPNNQIASVTQGGSTYNYTYDANGNLTSDGVHSYTYDAENRLVKCESIRQTKTCGVF